MAIKDKLYMSKSKKQLFDSCPYAFKLKYVENKPQPTNTFFEIGTDVHNFIDKFFEIVSANEKTGELDNLNNLELQGTENIAYKKNVTKFEMERWKTINNAKLDKTYFYPVMKEKQYILEKPLMIGIVDRVHKCCKADKFTPKVASFKDGDLIIVENKTGKPTAEKVKDYETDLLWYKIIIAACNPQLPPIKWGAVYFPYDNSVYHYKLTQAECRVLAKEINQTRKMILASLKANSWIKTTDKKNCYYCSYKNICHQ